MASFFFRLLCFKAETLGNAASEGLRTQSQAWFCLFPFVKRVARLHLVLISHPHFYYGSGAAIHVLSCSSEGEAYQIRPQLTDSNASKL